ncbi:hypothetical protein L3Q82_007873 [Scortum barcoo]|uniref:Uncharacterized protein n=1 Tax=Scortum barcoo TaxID=214431 RepID=A0ACB8WJZ8_9TELE|nr:hypothetical protein L3Q82_007873 [Scortum barcoo]
MYWSGLHAAECEAAGMRISTSKSEAMVLDRKRVACPLQVGGEVLPQVEEFKYLGVLFTSEGKMEREIDRQIGAASAVMRSVYRTVNGEEGAESKEPAAKEPEPILPPDRVVGAVTWQIENDVQRASQGEPAPEGCPRNQLFVPEAMHSKVIHWAPTSLLTCHPGIKRMVFVVQQRFWWPTLAKDVAEYITACSVCARRKASRQVRMGLLQPLPVPHRPWSHLSLDFVTGLPPSRGNMVVVMVVDRFSEITHFIPLTKLPTAKETAVFRIHGLPTDIVSDRGPQFNQTSWSDHLIWIKYAHNSLPTAATGLSPFQVIHGYQPPLFPVNKEEVMVPSAHALARRCRKIWAALRRMLSEDRPGRRPQQIATTVLHQSTHRARKWLCTKDLP